MISLDQCRQLLGPDSQLSDQELERLRDDFYALADIAVTALLGVRRRPEGGARTNRNLQAGESGRGSE